MKKLGLIGGVGPESTILYYKGIVYGVKERVGKPYLPPLTIESLSCFEVIRMSSEGDAAGLTAYLLAGIHNLAAAGAEVGALACNTGHMVFDELQKVSPIPLISIVDTSCAEAMRKGYQKVGLLGTSATMEADFFKRPFRKAGILGCTELLLLFEGRSTPVPLLDTIQIHIRALVDAVMEE